MTYAIAGTALSLQPETGKWLPRAELGVDGSGHPVYPALREFEMGWSLMDAASWNQLCNLFDTVSTTGTVVASLPEYGAAAYAFKSYSGCTLLEPEVGEYFEEHVVGVRLVLLNIKV